MVVALSEKITRKIRNGIVIITFFVYFLYTFNGLERVGLSINDLQYRSIALFLTFLLVFIFRPLSGRQAPGNGLPWYDILFILVSLTFSAYIVLRYEDYWVHLGFVTSNFELALGLVAIVITLEAVRRTIGNSMTIIILVFLGYSLLGSRIPGFLHTPSISLSEMSGALWLSAYALYGAIIGVLLDYVFVFIIFAAVLEVVGGVDFFRDLTLMALARFRGASGKVTVVSNLLFGMVSGSSIANVFLTAPFTLPRMKKEGFKDHYSGAVLATATQVGQITPPVMGVVAFVMADLLGVPYVRICIAATIPAILYAGSLFLLVDLDFAKAGLQPVPILPEERIPIKTILLDGWHIIVGIIVMIVLLGGMYTTVKFSIVLVCALLILLGSLRKKTRINFRGLKKIVRQPTMSLIDIAPICAGAGLIVGVVGLTSLDYKFSVELTALAGGNMFLMLMFAAVACIILGMGMPTLPAYLIVVMIVGPGLVPFGLDPIQIHLFVNYFALASMVTPPVCLTVYVVAPLVKASIWRVGLSAVRLSVATYIVPFMFIAYPGILLIGKPLDIIGEILLCLCAIMGIVIGLSRYFLVNASWPEVILAFSGAFSLILPFGLLSNLVGGSLLAVVLLVQVMRWRVAKQKLLSKIYPECLKVPLEIIKKPS